MKKKEEKKQRNQRKKEIIHRIIKDGIIRYIRIRFEQQEEKYYYKSKRVINF